MNKWLVFSGILILVLVAACGPANEGRGDGGGSEGAASPGNSAGEITPLEEVRLAEDYSGALSIQVQLAAGTLLLEDTDQAVDETQAAALLPLWQGLQGLSSSEIASSVEIEALLDQIQETMRPEQVAAIKTMALTEESITQMIETGEFSFGRGGFGGTLAQNAEEGDQSGSFPGGGIPGGGPGGFPGGGPGGGGFGGRPDGGFQGADPDAIATRQAQFAGTGPGAFLDRGLTGAVVRLLGTKTGEISADQFGVVFDIVGEATGLGPEEVRAQTADGATLAQVITASGSDVEPVRQALIEAFSELPNADELDVETLVSQWLGLDQ